MDAQLTSPWKSEDGLPLKPRDKGDYGYLRLGRFIPSSREELIRRCKVPEVPEVELIWFPDSERLVPVSEVPFLQEALRAAAVYSKKQNLLIALINSIFFSISAWFAREHTTALLFLAVGAVTGFWPLLAALFPSRQKEPAAQQDNIRELTRFSGWLGVTSPKATWGLAGVLLGIGVLQVIFGYPETINAAGLVKPAVREGEWWRLFTAPFLHGSPLHLLLNVSALITLGKLVEVLGSRHHFAAVFCSAALAGSFFSYVFLPESTSVGASGGLMGLLGFLIVLGLRHRSLLPEGFARSLAISLVLMAAIGLVGYQFIDNAAHLGGFVAGLLGGSFLVPREARMPLGLTPVTRVLGRLAGAFIVVAILLTIYQLIR